MMSTAVGSRSLGTRSTPTCSSTYSEKSPFHGFDPQPMSTSRPASPPHPPPMKTFLGVPILLRGVAYGNLYLTEKAGGTEFTSEDEELTKLLAAQAAVAIENARLYEAAKRWSKQLESLNEVSTALASETDLHRVLELVASRLRELVDARLVLIALTQPDGHLRVEVAIGEGGEDLPGTRLAGERSKLARVLERRRSERVDSLIDDLEVDQDIARRMSARTGLYVPLVVQGRVIGGMSIHDKLGADARFADEDLRLGGTFAPRVATAVDLSERVARGALRRVVAAQELERRRLARELHDETGQALTSILLGLKPLEDALEKEENRAAVAELRELVVATLQDVRRLAVELRPKVLDDFGLVAALERLTESFAEQTGIAVDFEANVGEERLPSEIETALYRIVQESLTNVVKHAHARRVSILLARKESALTAVVEDDGRGFDPAETGDGFGIEGMRERVALLDGRLAIEPNGAGTTLVAEVPLR